MWQVRGATGIAEELEKRMIGEREDNNSRAASSNRNKDFDPASGKQPIQVYHKFFHLRRDKSGKLLTQF